MKASPDSRRQPRPAAKRSAWLFAKPLFVAVTTAALYLAGSSIASADFIDAYKKYREGKFAEASTEFTALAELGSGAAQFNLGAMAARGEGQEKNPGTGVGWMQAAAENGYPQLSAAQIADFRSKLTPAQLAEADMIVARYGRKALEERVFPGRMGTTCRQFRPASREQYAEPIFPPDAAAKDQDGVVMVEFTVGLDGLARDPHVIADLPSGIFDDVTIDAALKSRFKPATRDGQPVVSRMTMHMTFTNQGGDLWQLKSVRKIQLAADERNPYAEYIIGLIGSLDKTLNVPQEKARAMLLSSAQAGVPQAQYWISRELIAEELCGHPEKMVLWLSNAAKGGDPAAQVELVHLRSGAANAGETNELRKMLVAAVGQNNRYALKHAAALFAMSPIAELRDGDLALKAANKLRRMSGSLDPHIDEAIAAAYGANGMYREARRFQESAIDKAHELFWNTSKMNLRLATYAEGRPATGDIFDVPVADMPLPPVRNKLEDCTQKRRGCGRSPDGDRTPTGSFLK